MPALTEIKLAALARGLATFVPAARRFTNRGTGGTLSARYCYSVWLRHLVCAHDAGRFQNVNAVGEFGPGDSIGAGLAALLSGVRKYYAFDVKPHAHSDSNLRIFEELIDLFARQAPIPDESEFPFVIPKLKRYEFPRAILTGETLRPALQQDRLAAIRRSLAANSEAPDRIRYIAPWHDSALVEPGTIDMIFSQAVMEHVEDVPGTYRVISRCLRPGGLLSQSVDFNCHGNTHRWNGHWTVSDSAWKIIRGNRSYLINRLPHSGHIAEIEKAGFRIVSDIAVQADPLPRNLLAPRFRHLSDSDLRISGAFIQAIL